MSVPGSQISRTLNLKLCSVADIIHYASMSKTFCHVSAIFVAKVNYPQKINAILQKCHHELPAYAVACNFWKKYKIIHYSTQQQSR